MAKEGNHIIDKLVIDLNISGLDQSQCHVLGEKVKYEVSSAIKNLDKKIGNDFNDNFYQLDRVLIDLDTAADNLQNLDRRIEEALLQKISSLSPGGEKQPESINFSEVAPQEHIQKLSLFFLGNGHFPWWSGKNYELPDIIHWFEDMPADLWIKEIMPVLKSDPFAVDRLTLQFPNVAIKNLIAKTVGNTSFSTEAFSLIDDLTDFLRHGKGSNSAGQVNKAKTRMYQTLWREVIAVQNLTRPNLSKATLNELVNSALVLPDQLEEWKTRLRKSKKAKAGEWLKKLDFPKIKKNVADEVDRENISKKVDSKDFEVQQAGLVLVHPFIKTLFERLELLQDGLFRDTAAKERAVCLLHFLATGEETFDEPKLILPKHLCDWPMGVPVDRFLAIDDHEKEECNKVLESVTKQWRSLKNTTPEGLRENFIKREGKLKKEAFGWSLYVGRKTQDLLLDKMPWGFSKIKFKWMESVLTVNWN